MDDAWPWKRAQPTGNQPSRSCASFVLPSLGTIQIAPGHYIELEADALFVPSCPPTAQAQINAPNVTDNTLQTNPRDPFHASITPQAYATGAATVIAWMLVIMLIITPRTFFVGGGASGRSGLMGRRGMIGGASGGGSIIGVGTRPWLQKVAALTVAISLTLATADTFRIAEKQYEGGYMDAIRLRDEVVSGMEIKVSRLISDIFLWLAQVQTLIRLFPRHKEKVIIKWVGFALILLDITFTSLNSFGPYSNKSSPRHFETAIPALSYLFQLSLSMLYAAWVMYYAITKRRYAFYHPMMWNLSLVAFLSFIAILTPVVFFITDISNYTIAGWGDYFRWVGAAAASVIVWEWVERIEALEREEKKDGILGREIYDGDEMLDTTPSHDVTWPRNTWASDDKKSGDGGNQGVFTTGHTARLANLAHRIGGTRKGTPKTEARKKRTIHIPAPLPAVHRSESTQRSNRNSRTYIPIATPPAAVASPVSRTDTASADSTVYNVRYHTVSDSPPTIPNPIQEHSEAGPAPAGEAASADPADASNLDPEKGVIEYTADPPPNQSRWNWQAMASVNPFRRKGRSPPPEVQRGRVIEPLVVEDVPVSIPQRNYTGLALKDRLGTFAAHQGERFRSRSKEGAQAETNLPVTIIPAQPRGRTWSPEILKQQESSSAASGTHTDGEETGSKATTGDSNQQTSQQDAVPAVIQQEQSQSSSSSRNSRLRFIPETFQRRGIRQSDPQIEGSSRPYAVALGAEVRDASANQPSADSPVSSSQPARTDHDR